MLNYQRVRWLGSRPVEHPMGTKALETADWSRRFPNGWGYPQWSSSHWGTPIVGYCRQVPYTTGRLGLRSEFEAWESQWLSILSEDHVVSWTRIRKTSMFSREPLALQVVHNWEKISNFCGLKISQFPSQVDQEIREWVISIDLLFLVSFMFALKNTVA